MTDETQRSGAAPEFLLSGDDVAEAFMGLVASSDPILLRTVFSNTALLFLAKEQGNAQDMTPEEFARVLEQVTNETFELLVNELEDIRDTKVAFARSGLPLA